jgi:glycosyltransferase 2 family protein
MIESVRVRQPATPAEHVAEAERAVATEPRHWRDGWFGPASERPFQRRAVDVLRLLLATAALIVLSLRANTLPRGERGLFTYFNTLPSLLEPLFRALFAGGTLWAVGLVVAAALVGRRWRLAFAMSLCGLAAWAAARVIGAIVVDRESLRRSLHVVTHVSGASPHFPQARIAILVAILAAAAPFVSRPIRVVGGTLVLGAALAAMYLGVGYPRDVVAGAVLGWGIAAAAALVFGSPGGRPTTRQVALSLGLLGVDASDVHLAPQQPFGATVMLARDPDGPLVVRVLGRDATDTQFMAKLLRGIAYKESGPPLTATRLHQLQLQALTILLARDNGARSPHLVVVGKAGRGAALLVERPYEGRTLADLPADSIDDATLDAVWKQVAALHGARVVHGRMNASHVMMTADGPALIDFDRAKLSAAADQRARDVAELLASTAALVGDERAAAACARVMGRESLAGALPVLQPAALERSTRSAFNVRRHDLDDRLAQLRDHAAHVAGVDAPELQRLNRISAANLGMAIGTLIALGALLSQIGSPGQLWDAFTGADWWWVVASIVLSLGTNLPYAIALMGSVPSPLPLWPTTECQLAMSFSNLAIPLVGGDAIQVRFLQKQGLDLAAAVAAGGVINTVGNAAVQLGLFVLALAVTPDKLTLHLPTLRPDVLLEYVLGAVFVLGVITAIVVAVRQLRERVIPPLARAAGTLWAVARSPRRLSLLVAGNIGAAVLYAFALEADVIAFGVHVSFWTLLALSIAFGTLSALIPVSGGGTAVSTVGMTGALTALHVPEAAAAGAVLINQVAVTYLPALPGWIATRDMVKRNYL